MMKTKLENEVKIMSLEGSSILRNNLEQHKVDKKPIVTFSQSLLLNKLVELGLNVSNSTTRDIINVKFTYGFSPKKVKELQVKIDELKAVNKDSVAGDKNYSTKQKENRVAERNQNRGIIKEYEKRIEELKLGKDMVREKLYEGGFFLDYYKVKKDKNKRIVRDVNGKKMYEPDKRINYKYWFRTSAKARVGEVFFINEDLLHSINEWQNMGIEFAEDEPCKLVEIEAYKALTASSLEGLMYINARTQILVINDLESYSAHKCKLVKTDEDENCYVEDGDNYKLKNILFDGQALIDSSLIQNNPITKNKGGVLLRSHMFKSFALNTNITKFMQDYFGEDYDTAYIEDKYGREIKVSNIKLITTENSMKWERFDFTCENWCDAVEADNNLFGIVKTEQPSKYGDLQRTSYQMLNSLDPDKIDIENILEDTLEFTDNIQNNIDLYIEYLDITKSEMNSNELLVDLHRRNKDIAGTQLFRDYKKYKIREWKDRLKSGKLLINGDNLTIIGNPYAMLLHSVGLVPHIGDTIDSSYIDIALGRGNTCYTTRFEDAEELACFRSPHNSPNNIYYCVNTRNKLMAKYFNCTPNIICVNLIGTKLQDRLSGSDQDSDFALVTNQTDIVNFAKESQHLHPTIINCINQDTRQYKSNMESMAKIDNALAKGKNDIGVASNIAQEALSWYYDSKDSELADVFCIASVLADCAIDNAKRMYSVDVQKQIKIIEKSDCMQVKTEDGEKAKPSFWQYTSKSYDKKKDAKKLLKVNCTMCLLEDEISKIRDSKRVKNVDILKLLDDSIKNNYAHKQVQSVTDKYRSYRDKDLYLISQIMNSNSDQRKQRLRDGQKDNLMEFNVYIAKTKINSKNMKELVKQYANKKNGLDIDFLRILYNNKKEVFLGVFVEDEKGVKQETELLVS